MSKLEEVLLSLGVGESVVFSCIDFGIRVETRRAVGESETRKEVTVLDPKSARLPIDEIAGLGIIERAVRRDLHRVRADEQAVPIEQEGASDERVRSSLPNQSW